MTTATFVIGLTLIVNAVAVLDVGNDAVKRAGQQAGATGAMKQAVDGIANLLSISKFFRTVLGLWNILVALLFIFWW